MGAELDFNDLSLIEIPVKIDGKVYTLREANGDASCRYRNAQLACTELGVDGKPARVVGLADVEPLLVSLCLFDENNRPVSAAIVRKWPSRVVSALFEKVKEISDLGEEKEESAKNVSSDTEDGSD